MDQYADQKTVPIPSYSNMQVPETPAPFPSPGRVAARRSTASRPLRTISTTQNLREQCKQLALSIFFRTGVTINSLGFTSSIAGEGKSFLATTTARAFSEESSLPIILLDCNWDHPKLHEFFGCAPTPGLAEWIRGECNEGHIRQQVGNNLTLIPAGNGKHDAIKLLQHMQHHHLLDMLTSSEKQRQLLQRGMFDTSGHPQHLLIVDLPAVMTNSYAVLAASLLESLLFVVCSGVTPKTHVAEAYSRMRNLPVQGVVLNQIESHVPSLIRQML